MINFNTNYLIIFIAITIITLLLTYFIRKNVKDDFKNKDIILIPQKFKIDTQNLINNLFNNTKYYNNLIIINGIETPLNIKTDHMKYNLNSPEHINILIELFYLLNMFYEYSIKNNILYTLSAGNLLGYYRGSVILPWDDDIDVMVKDTDFDKIIELWVNNNQKETDIWDKNWSYKKINLNSQDIFLLKHKNRKFFKIKLSIDNIEKSGKFQKDIGGLDIELMSGYSIGGPSKPLQNEIIEILNNTNEEDYEIIQYGHAKTRIIRKELALLLLNKMYPRWKEKKHPKLFK